MRWIRWILFALFVVVAIAGDCRLCTRYSISKIMSMGTLACRQFIKRILNL